MSGVSLNAKLQNILDNDFSILWMGVAALKDIS